VAARSSSAHLRSSLTRAIRFVQVVSSVRSDARQLVLESAPFVTGFPVVLI
jgi:hypothetical protein